jgi:pimeloyl-ACP methyl ester carboxylesterase
VPVLKSFADGRLFGTTWGDGTPTVLALHGWRRTHADFSAVFAPGDATSGGPAPTALGVDLAGFGATPVPPDPWSSADYARSLLGLFEEPGRLADRVTVLGHSFGGRVALFLAALASDRVDRLVLTGVPLLERQGRRARPAPGFRLARRLHRLGLVGDDRMEALRQRHGSPDYRAATGVMRSVFVGLLAEDYAPAMAAVRCPVSLVWGAADSEVPVEVAERARPLFPRASLEVLPGIGHLTPTEAPAALRRAVGQGA